MSDQPQPQFGIEKLYVKDASLECPNSPEIFLESEAPQIEVKIFNEGKKVGEDLYEVTLTATVTAKLGERTAYLVERRRPAFSAWPTCRTRRWNSSCISLARICFSPISVK